MATKRIGILTGGGDVPGLNSVIKEVTYRATENNCEVYRDSPRVERSDGCQSGRSGQQGQLHPAAHAREHPHHRSLRRHRAAQQPD